MPSGDSGKIIRGSEFETEFDNIATAIATKADAADPTFTGTVTIDGLTVNGNTVLGNAATDTVTVTADIASNLIPSADDTYNLGASGAEWNDLFIDGTANIDSLVADTADINGGTIDGVTIGGSSAGAITGTTITGTGFVTSGNMTFGDNDKALFGAGSDLQIYHDGSNSYINDNGSGNLVLRGGNFVVDASSAGNERLITANATSKEVKLYYNDAEKLATTSTGIDVTGTVTADGLTVNSGATNTTSFFESTDATADIVVADTNTSNVLRTNSGGLFINTGGTASTQGTGATPTAQFATNGDVSFYEDTGTTAKFFWDASAESLGIGTSSPTNNLDIAAASSATLSVRNTSTISSILLSNGSSANQVFSRGINSSTGRDLAFVQGTAEAMRIDSNGNVGIGTVSPAQALHVASTGSARIRIDDTDTAKATASALIEFTGSDGRAAYMGADSGSFVTDLESGTRMTWRISGSEAMRIDSSGNVLVGKTSASVATAGIQLLPDSDSAITRDAGTVLYLNRNTSDGTIAEFRKDGTAVGSIGTTGGDLMIGTGDVNIRFDDGADAIVPRNSDGSGRDAAVDIGLSTVRFKDLYLSGGAYIGGTAAANLLDDYEEGTWTPVYEPASGSFTTMTTEVVNARYTKIGNTVICSCYIRTDNVDTTGASGALKISGLPFVSNVETGVCAVGYALNWGGDAPSGGHVNFGTSEIDLNYRTSSSAGITAVDVSDLTTGASSDQNRIMLIAQYRTSA